MAKVREESSSITKLVKIVAAEVFEEKWAEKEREMRVGSPKSNAGSPWNEFEDAQLRREMVEAVERIAEAHGRTTGAIMSRMKQNHLIYTL